MIERNEIKNETAVRRNINFVPMDHDELVVDWSSGVVETNVGEGIITEESTTDRSRQQAEELLGKLFELPEGLPPEAPWRVIGSSAGLPTVILNQKGNQNVNQKSYKKMKQKLSLPDQIPDSVKTYSGRGSEKTVRNYLGRESEKKEDPPIKFGTRSKHIQAGDLRRRSEII